MTLKTLLIATLTGLVTLAASADDNQATHDNDFDRLVSSWERLYVPSPEEEILLDLVGGGSEWGKVCSTSAPNQNTRNRVDSELAAAADELGEFHVQTAPTVTIPLVIWNITKVNGTGSIYQDQLDEQVRVLNKRFKKIGVKFTVQEAWYVPKNGWFKKCGPMKPNGRVNKKAFRIRKKLAIDPAHAINIYICQMPGDGLGWATFPWDAPESSKFHGISLHYKALPGGEYESYNLGNTLVHEMGHYFGLYHTFTPWELEGMTGCDAPGDDVGDTPFEAEPAFGCQIGRDTCPQSGADPVTNFMDYSDDECRVKFSRGQRNRMTDAVILYRPRLVGLQP